MKRNSISKFALAIALAFGAAAAMANPAGNNGNSAAGSISGAAAVGGQYTIGQVNGNVNATSQTEGNAVSATRVNGNGYSSQQTTSIGTGSASGSVSVQPNSVNASTSQTSTSNVVSVGVSTGNTPALDDKGLIVNGAAGLSTTSTVANATVNQNITGQTGYIGIEGTAGFQATGAVAGW